METADVRVLQAAMISAADAIIEAEPELTRIDSIIGDGDHGIGMKTGFTALKEELESAVFSTPYQLFHACGLCLVKCMGGSSGVLFGTLLVGGLEKIQDKTSLDGRDFYAFLSGGIDDVMRRGRAKAGDKTMVDALLSARTAMEAELKDSAEIDRVLQAAVTGAKEGVENTKTMLPRLGRSKNFREQAMGWPDPGAISVSVLLQGMLNGISTFDQGRKM